MAHGWRGEGLSSEGEPERMRFAGRADSIGRTYQDDSERSSRRKANEAETGGANRLINCRRDPPRQRSSLREFLCRIWYLCWNLTRKEISSQRYPLPGIQVDTHYLRLLEGQQALR